MDSRCRQAPEVTGRRDSLRPNDSTRHPSFPLIDASTDGTLWMRRTSSILARHDDSGWTVFTAADGVPQMG